MTAPLEGHPFGDLRAILDNYRTDGDKVLNLPYFYTAEFDRIAYTFLAGEASPSGMARLRQRVDDVLDRVASFADLTFFEEAEPDITKSNLNFQLDADLEYAGQASSCAYSLDDDDDVDVLVGTATINPAWITPGVLMHEIGHLLTLTHTGPNQLPDQAPFLDPQYRNNNYTVMHYDEAGEGPAFGEWDYRDYGIIDIYAIQLRFGANMATFAGDDVHDARTLWADGKAGYRVTLWDAGGHDVLDFSDIARDQLIDLRAGRFSDAGETPGAAPGLVPGDPLDFDYAEPDYNLALAIGVEIDDARGGSGNDMIIGNEAANAIYGGAGDDVIYGDGA